MAACSLSGSARYASIHVASQMGHHEAGQIGGGASEYISMTLAAGALSYLEVSGFVRLQVRSLPGGGPAFELASVYVSPEGRGKGIGTQLVSRLVSKFREEQVPA